MHYASTTKGVAYCGRKSADVTVLLGRVTCNACARKWLKWRETEGVKP